jgi:hypothetical protein
MSVLAIIQLVLSALTAMLPTLVKNPAYGSIAQSIQAAIDSLANAHTELITKQELEALRTHPQW